MRKKGGGGKKTFEKESIKRQAHNLQFFPTTHLFCSLWVYTVLFNYTFLSYGEKRRVKKNERKIIKNARYIRPSFPYHTFVLFTPSRPGGPLIYILILQRKKEWYWVKKNIARSIKTTAHNVQFFQHFLVDTVLPYHTFLSCGEKKGEGGGKINIDKKIHKNARNIMSSFLTTHCLVSAVIYFTTVSFFQ